MANEKDHGPRLGADPELFVQNDTGTIIPVCGRIGGTKEQPLIIDNLIEATYGPEGGRRNRENVDRRGNYAVQEDNVMLEFNIPAYREGSYFTDAITKMLAVMENSVLSPKDLRFKCEVMHTFRPESLEPFLQAFTVGCLPDLDAYVEGDNRERQPFSAVHFGNHRFCGGHLHVQYNHNNVPRHIFAQFMDVVAQLPFIRWDKQKMRRMFYGLPGLYREKPYGIEYRTPSNFWLGKQFRDKWLGAMVENVLALARQANNDPEFLKNLYGRIDWHDVQQAVKTEDVKLADEIVEYVRNKLGMPICGSAQR